MKKMMLIVLVLLLFSGCAVLQEMLNKGTQGAVEAAVAGSGTGAVDFKSGEVLCSYGEGSVMDVNYYAATIATPASAETKNQAQVIYVADGVKAWAQFVIPSHKAAKAELKQGAVVFGGYTGDYNSIDSYRKTEWLLGRITNLDELFKDIVEINGRKFNIAVVRIPDTPITE